MEVITVMRSPASSRSVLTSEFAAVESSPEVGSSRSRMLGLVSSSVPMLQRFFSPPEIIRIFVSAHFSMRSVLITCSTTSRLVSLDRVSGRRR